MYRKDALHIQAVIGLGDNTNWGDPWEYESAQTGFESMRDAGLKIIPCYGNHDAPLESFNTYFGADFLTGSYYQGSKSGGGTENSYYFIDIGDDPYIVIILTCWPSLEVLTWAGALLETYSEKSAIIVTHGYLVGTTRMGSGCFACPPVGSPSGQDMWDLLFSQYENVKFVFCGHRSAGSYMRSDAGVNGNIVHQMISDFNDGANGAILTVLLFDRATNKIQSRTYKPRDGSGWVDSEYLFDWYR